MPFTSSQSTAQATRSRTEASAPARVVLLDNRDSFVYNLVDQFATLGSQIEVYRNNVPASRVLAALEPTEAERQAGRRPVLCLSPGPGYPATSGCLMELIATALVQAGAGVVAASSPAAEAAETVHKARAVLEAVAAAQGATLVIDRTGNQTGSRTDKEA